MSDRLLIEWLPVVIWSYLGVLAGVVAGCAVEWRLKRGTYQG